jgi:hypothetical protein
MSNLDLFSHFKFIFIGLTPVGKLDTGFIISDEEMKLDANFRETFIKKYF